MLSPQVEETVARMVSVEAQLGTAWVLPALGAHLEWFVAANTELELALSAGKMHAAALGESVAEVTLGTGDPVLGQVLLQPGRLVVRVVLLLPAGEVLAGDAVVLGLPGLQALGAGHGPAVRADQLLVLRVSQETKGALNSQQSCQASRDKGLVYTL